MQERNERLVVDLKRARKQNRVLQVLELPVAARFNACLMLAGEC